MNANISLCITCYDQDYILIHGLLKEFEKQTCSPKEIIVYISGIHETYIPKQININGVIVPVFTIFSSKRTNQAKARNICAKIASENYVIFFDVDDIPHIQKIDISRLIIDQYSDIDFVLHNYDTNNKHYSRAKLFPIENIELYRITDIDKNSTNIICENFNIHHSHILVKRNIFEKVSFNETNEFYRKEDGKFCQDLVLNDFKGFYCPYKLVNYTI